MVIKITTQSLYPPVLNFQSHFFLFLPSRGPLIHFPFLGWLALFGATINGQWQKLWPGCLQLFSQLMSIDAPTWTSKGNWSFICSFIHQVGMMLLSSNLAMRSNFSMATTCWHGIPFFLAMPQVHVPQWDPLTSKFRNFIVFQFPQGQFSLTLHMIKTSSGMKTLMM